MPYIGNIVQDFSVSTAMLNDESVTSIKIDDGSIVDADINASAAIAGSKITPVFSIDGTFNGLTIGKGANSVTQNTVLGVNALDAAVTGNFNTAVGHNALTDNTSGNSNLAIGS